MTIYQLEDRVPKIAENSFVAPSADVIGSVTMAAQSSIWFNAVARGDNDIILIGESSNVQDNVVLHTDPGYPLTIESGVTVGHSAMLHGCRIGRNSLIGIGSVILNGAEIGESCIVGANSLIAEGKIIPERSLVIGSPGRVIRQLSEKEVLELSKIAKIYVDKTIRYQSLKQLS